MFVRKLVADGIKYLSVCGFRVRYGEVVSHRDINQTLTDRFANVEAMLADIQWHQRMADIYRCAQIVHPQVFPKYRNCHAGKEMVFLAAGPTLDYYDLRQDALYLGVNKVFYSQKVDLDYLFVEDSIPAAQDDMDAYEGRSCKKFYGVHYSVSPIAQCHADRAHAERFYFIDGNMTSLWPYPPDISCLPLSAYSSVVHPALQFALWTGVKRIYLVGCDTSQGGYSTQLGYRDASKNTLQVDRVLEGWRRMKDFASKFYPETEIVSINPVGLRGMFRDVYTKSYLADHPEIGDEGTVIE